MANEWILHIWLCGCLVYWQGLVQAFKERLSKLFGDECVAESIGLR